MESTADAALSLHKTVSLVKTLHSNSDQSRENENQEKIQNQENIIDGDLDAKMLLWFWPKANNVWQRFNIYFQIFFFAETNISRLFAETNISRDFLL